MRPDAPEFQGLSKKPEIPPQEVVGDRGAAASYQ